MNLYAIVALNPTSNYDVVGIFSEPVIKQYSKVFVNKTLYLFNWSYDPQRIVWMVYCNNTSDYYFFSESLFFFRTESEAKDKILEINYLANGMDVWKDKTFNHRNIVVAYDKNIEEPDPNRSQFFIPTN